MSNIRKKLEFLLEAWYNRTNARLTMFVAAIITLMLITILTTSEIVIAVITLVIVGPFLSVVIVMLTMQISDLTFQKKEEKYLQKLEKELPSEYVRIEPVEESLETEILSNMGVSTWAKLKKDGNKEKIIILMKFDESGKYYGNPKEIVDFESFCKNYRIIATNNPLV